MLQVWSARYKSPCLALVPLAAVLPAGGGLELGEAEAGVVSVQQRAVETLVAVEVARERELFPLTILGTRYIDLNLQNLGQQDLKSFISLHLYRVSSACVEMLVLYEVSNVFLLVGWILLFLLDNIISLSVIRVFSVVIGLLSLLLHLYAAIH